MNPIKFILAALRSAGVFGLHLDSGGGGQQASQTQVADLPEWAKPYAKETLGKGQALTQTPYQTYGGERQAGFTPLQQQSFGGAAQMQPSQLGAQAGQLAGAATMGALGTNYNPYETGGFTSQTAGQYMNPYLEQAMEPQLREAQRASQMQGVADQGQAVRAGAFGGGRQAIIESERQRNLGQLQGDIRAKGYMSAFDQAQQQFSREQQLREQSRQYGAGLGMQGLQTALQGAGQMGALGGQQFAQGMDINKLQNLYGQQQQAQEQAGLTQKYQDFQAQQKHPYQQLEFMSNLLRGTPMGTVSSLYQAPSNNLGTLAGLGIGAYGSLTRADGGMVDSYADGGVTDPNNVESIIDKLSDQQLQQAQEAATARGDAAQLQIIAQEMAQRASMRRGVAAGIPDQFADSMEEGMASGGIIAFAGGGDLGVGPEFGGYADTYEAPPAARSKSEVDRIIDELRGQGRTIGLSDVLDIQAGKGPTITKREAEKVVKQTAAPAAPVAAPEVKAEKPPREFQKAVKEIAKSSNVPESEITDQAMSLYQRMQNLHKPERDELNKLIEAQKGKSGEIKARGLSDALMNFGFTMASKASKPGASFLGSMGEASPAFGASIAKTQELESAAEENYNKLLMEQKKYEMATKRGDMKEADEAADRMAKRRFEQEKLNKEIEYRNRSLSVQAAGRDPAILQVADRLMAQPGFKGTMQDALEAAARYQGGAGLRSDTALQKIYSDRVEKEINLLRIEMQVAKTPAEQAAVQAKIDNVKRSIAADLGMGGGTQAASMVQRYDAKGNLIQ